MLTSASVHDSQVAIPLMTMTSARVFYLYDLMDAAYDAAAIVEQSKALGHVPLIDPNFRAQHEAKAECAEEVARMKFIHLPDPDDVLYDFRTMVERVNARLKDEFGGRFVRVRGAIKVKCHLMFGILALAVDQIFRVGRLHAGAGLTRDHSEPESGDKKITRSMNFARGSKVPLISKADIVIARFVVDPARAEQPRQFLELVGQRFQPPARFIADRLREIRGGFRARQFSEEFQRGIDVVRAKLHQLGAVSLPHA